MSQSSDIPEAPGGKPKFLDPTAAASDPYEHTPEDKAAEEAVTQSINEYDPQAGKPLIPRHRLVCQLLAAGKTTAFIMKQTGFSKPRMYQLMKSPVIIAEVHRLQDMIFQKDIVSRMKDLGPDAANVIEEVLRSQSIDPLKKTDTATWLIEKLTGKAKQEVSVESNTIAAFMEVMKQMQQSGERLEDIDVTPQHDPETQETPAVRTRPALPAAKGSSKFTKWVDEEL